MNFLEFKDLPESTSLKRNSSDKLYDIRGKFTEEKGVEIVKFSPEMLRTMRSAFDEVMADVMAKDPELKMVYDDLANFMKDYKSWENTGMIGRNQSAFD